jgi:hypothetical protein
VHFAAGARDQLRELLALSFLHPGRADDDLRHAVQDYVRHAKAELGTPESVISALKRAITDEAVARSSYRAANELTDRVIHWSIEAFYGGETVPERVPDRRFQHANPAS